jgi:hypothetical protein
MRCFAFTDESGNSGLNLFDTDQETFWTGTLIAYGDVDKKHTSFHKELLATVRKNELHGAELGFGGLEKIASRLSWFIREKKLSFSFGRVHKPFLACSKLFDLAFDSGANKAMPPLTYAVRHLRLINLLHFVQLLTLEDLREFWSLFEAQDPKRFGILLSTLAERVKFTPYDARSVQILSDVLRWGSQHPEAILDPFGKGDSPNFVAFCGLFGHLHSLHEQSGHVIGNFVHDEQNQFMSLFRESYDVLSRVQLADDRPLSIMSANIKELPSFDCSLSVRPSSQSFGLQLADVCMWLVRRVRDRGDEPRGNCRVLFECLIERSWLSHFDFEYLVRETRIGAEQIEQFLLSDEQLARGRAILRDMEESRLSRMARDDADD